MKLYIAIYNNEDGETIIQGLSREELLDRLQEDYWGKNVEILQDVNPKTLNNASRGGNTLIIIKGVVVSPRPVEVVKTFTIE